MVFIPYDYEDYNRQMGFLYDYFLNLPGPAVKSLKEFCSSLADIYKDMDKYREKRRSLRDRIHKFKDGDSCKRVMEIVDRLRSS